MSDATQGKENHYYLMCQCTIVLQNIVFFHTLGNGDLLGDGESVIQVFIGNFGKFFAVICKFGH